MDKHSHALWCMAQLALLLGLSISLCGCEDDKGLHASTAGAPLGIPPLKPPVDEATPSGLKGHGGRRLGADWAQLRKEEATDGRMLGALCLGQGNDGPDCKTEIQMIKARMFPSPSGGPQDFRYRLGKVDDRMQELNTRSIGGARKCVNESTKAWSPPTLPGYQDFTMHFSCAEKMNQEKGASNTADLRVYFGIKDSFAYIAEIQDPGAKGNGLIGAVLAKIKTDSSQVHVWTIGLTNDRKKVSLFEIQAKRDVLPTNDTVVRELEVAFASTEEGTSSFGCGVHLQSKSGSIRVNGTFADRDCAKESKPTSQGGSMSSACFNGASLSSSSEGCSSLNTPSFIMSHADCASYVQSAATLVSTFGNLDSLGLTGFNEKQTR